MFDNLTGAPRRASVVPRVIAFVAFSAMALCAPLHAGDEGGGTTSPFVLGAGSRTIAMGGTAAAVWGDSYALLWNPAGLFQVERNEVSLFHTSLFDESATYSSLMLAHPFLEIGVFSFGAVQLRVGGIERRDAENTVLEGELKNVQTRYVLGYARDIVSGFTVGTNLKLDRYAEDTYVANGFGVDVGIGLEPAVRSPLFDGMAMGLSFINILEPSVRLVEQEVGDPRAVRAGVSFRRSISRSLDDRLTVAVDFDKARFSETRIHAGAEYAVKSVCAVRGGWDAGIPTFGCGFHLSSLQFDYAYRSTELGGNHLFSLTCRFGSSRSERADLVRRRRDAEIQREIDVHILNYENESAANALANGKASLANRDYTSASDHFERVLLWLPSNEEARQGLLVANASLLMLRGDSLMTQGRLAEALLSYREASSEIQTSQGTERIRICERRIQETADNERTKRDILNRAIELYTQRNWDDAAAGFEEVLGLDPRNELAQSYLSKARAKIREAYERAFADAGRFIAEGRYGAAIQLLRQELERTPGDARLEAKISEIEVLRSEADRRKQQEAAAATAERPMKAEEREAQRAAYDRGVAFFKSGDFARAIGEWEDVWRAHPRFEQVSAYLVKAYQYLGMECYARHEYEKALEAWNKMLVVDPDNEKALRYIGKTKEELSKLEGLTTR